LPKTAPRPIDRNVASPNFIFTALSPFVTFVSTVKMGLLGLTTLALSMTSVKRFPFPFGEEALTGTLNLE